jgi:hypothetical protein
LGSDVVLVAPEGAVGAALKLLVPSSGEWVADNATVLATPRRATGLPWAEPLRNMAGGLAALLMAGFVVQLVRRARS